MVGTSNLGSWNSHWDRSVPWENEQSDTSKINFGVTQRFLHDDSKRSCLPWHFPRCHADAAYLVRDGLAATRLNRLIKMEVRSWNKNYKNWDWSMSLWHLWQSMAKDITKGGGKKCLESCSDWDSKNPLCGWGSRCDRQVQKRTVAEPSWSSTPACPGIW